MNEIANICERVGADVNHVRHGIARAIDFFGEYTDYNFSLSSEKADIAALNSDSNVIAEDMLIAFGKLQSAYDK